MERRKRKLIERPGLVARFSSNSMARHGLDPSMLACMGASALELFAQCSAGDKCYNHIVETCLAWYNT